MPTLEANLPEAATTVGRSLPRTNGRDRRRAAITAPRLAPGRYLAIEDADEVVVIEIAEDTLRLGRSVAADVMLEHLSVSRRHAVVARRGDDTVILDDRSLNGVAVNGTRVGEAVLNDGDTVAVGRVQLRFVER